MMSRVTDETSLLKKEKESLAKLEREVVVIDLCRAITTLRSSSVSTHSVCRRSVIDQTIKTRFFSKASFI